MLIELCQAGTPRHKERWDINPRPQAHLQSQPARRSCSKQGQTATSKALSSVPQMAKWQSNLKGPIHSPSHSLIHSLIHVHEQNTNVKGEFSYQPLSSKDIYTIPEFYKPYFWQICVQRSVKNIKHFICFLKNI